MVAVHNVPFTTLDFVGKSVSHRKTCLDDEEHTKWSNTDTAVLNHPLIIGTLL